MPKDSLDKIPIRMFWYGILAGMLAFVIVYGADSNPRQVYPEPFEMMVGLAVIGIWGGIASLCSGIGMVGRIKTGYSDDLRNHMREFRHQVSTRTTVISMIVTSPFLFCSLLSLMWGEPILLVCLLLAIGIIVLFSQYTISQYWRETDIRKPKQK